ncbi:hypothetical protein HZB90_00940 [archaeon]|nr:hypothetical protein [archaeon]
MALSKKALTLFALAAAYAGSVKDADAQQVSHDSPPGQAQPASQADSAAYRQVSDPVMVGTAAQQPDVWAVVTDEAQAVCGDYYSITNPCPDLAQIQRVRSAIQEPGRAYHMGTFMVTKNGQVDYENSYDFWGMNDIDHGGVRDERRITAEIVGVPGITDGTEVNYVPDEYGSTQFRAWELQSVVDAIEGAVGFPLTNEQIIWSIAMPNVHKGEGRPNPNDIVIFRASSVADNSQEVRISSAPNAGTDAYDVTVRCHDPRCTGENHLPMAHWDRDGQIMYLPDGTFIVHAWELEGLDNPMVLYNPVTGRNEEFTDGVFATRMDADFPQASHTAVVAPQTTGTEGPVYVIQQVVQQGTLPQCSDGADNDLDTLVDRMDPGCETGFDNDEYNAVQVLPQCSDRLDNDGDGLFDAGDPGCENGFDNDEYNAIAGPVCPPCEGAQCPPVTDCPTCPPAPGCPAPEECPTCPEPGATVEPQGNGAEVPPTANVEPITPTNVVPPSNVDVRLVVPPAAQPEESFFNPKVMLGARVAYIFNENLHNVAADYVLPMILAGGNIEGSNWDMYGAVGFSYAGESSVVDPRSRTTLPNPDDPMGLTSVVSGATETDDYVVSAGIGAQYRMDWFQLDMGAGVLAVVRDRDSYRDELLLFPNGEIADEQHFTDSDVDPVFAGYVSGGLGLRADHFSFDLGGMLIVDEDANVSGGPYAGFAVYWGGSEDPEDEQ